MSFFFRSCGTRGSSGRPSYVEINEFSLFLGDFALLLFYQLRRNAQEMGALTLLGAQWKSVAPSWGNDSGCRVLHNDDGRNIMSTWSWSHRGAPECSFFVCINVLYKNKIQQWRISVTLIESQKLKFFSSTTLLLQAVCSWHFSYSYQKPFCCCWYSAWFCSFLFNKKLSLNYLCASQELVGLRYRDDHMWSKEFIIFQCASDNIFIKFWPN